MNEAQRNECPKKKSELSELEETLALHLRTTSLPQPEREYRLFAHHVGMGAGIKQRLADAGLNDYRFDFAWPDIKLAVEVNGGIWMGKSGHNTGS